MTEKQMRAHLFRIWYRWEKLTNALNDAHNDGLIAYPKDIPYGNSVCDSHWETRRRIEVFTKEKIAEIVQREVRSQA